MKRIILLCSICFVVHFVDAQVTVGDLSSPEKGMLLEVKSKPADSDNVTSEQGGVLLPRVVLKKADTLEPFIETSASEWNSSNQAATKMKHAGLMVYNLSTTADGLIPGVYTWDGQRWTVSGRQVRYFYPPAFNLPLDKSQNPNTFNLYDEYQRQFIKLNNTANWVSTNGTLASVPSPELGRLYQRDELHYTVIHYDKDIIEIINISDQGEMTYTVKDDDPGGSSFLNLVFVLK